MTCDQFVFVGFNSRVAALDRETGELKWQWRATQGKGYVSLLLDRDRLIVSVQGYTYCLDPQTGEQRWFNPLPGFGTGVTCLASVSGTTETGWLAAVADEVQRAQQSAASTPVGTLGA